MTDVTTLGPVEAMDAALAGHPCELIGADGGARPLNVGQWTGRPNDADHFLFLDRCSGPTLDVGCGAGRLVGALAAYGVEALGIDISSEAVRLAQERGAVAVVNDVFATVPKGGHWQYAMLADTNVGIGGHPVRLLRRIRQLVHPEGAMLIEVEAHGTGVVLEQVRLRVGGRVSAAFDWSRVGADAIEDIGAAAGLYGCELHRMGARYVAILTREGGS